MKISLRARLGFALVLATFAVGSIPVAQAATCAGDNGICKACRTCEHCKHCSKKGGICSVCAKSGAVTKKKAKKGKR